MHMQVVLRIWQHAVNPNGGKGKPMVCSVRIPLNVAVEEGVGDDGLQTQEAQKILLGDI